MKFIPTFFLLVALSITFGALASCTSTNPSRYSEGPCFKFPQEKPEETRPNILFILTDDMDLNSLSYMPNVQALLIDQGVVLENFFINVPQCCPSRSTILLGQYSQNSGILRNGGGDGGFKTFFRNGLEQNTIAAGLHRSGYQTVLLGKYLNGYPSDVKKRTYVPPGWDEWYVPVAGTPYNNYNYKLNENGKIINYHSTPDDYLTDVLSNKTDDFIRRKLGSDQPFFIYLSTYAPHGPATPAKRHTHLFSDVIAPRYGSFNEEDVSDKPLYIQKLPDLTQDYEPGIDHLYRARLQSLQAVDEMVARLVQTLEETGQMPNTYIFFTSDNGFHLGQHRMEAGKLSPYEEDIHVPFVVRGPEFPTGVTLSIIAGNVDLAPTFAEMAGLLTGKYCDGRSLVSVIKDETDDQSWRDAFLISFYAGRISAYESTNGSGDETLEPPDKIPVSDGEEGDPDVPAFKGLRTADYLYMEYDTGERELYNVKQDPYQLENLAETAKEQLLKVLSSWLKRLSTCAGENCQLVDQEPKDLSSP